ncbi:MAG: nucleotide pyrophosphatase/phosphodiesterase family protein [Rhodothermales bacterium]
MPKLAVLNVVGLTPALLSHAPFLSRWSAGKQIASISPILPAVTCSVQSTFLTGVVPSVHGIVGNGWYFRDLGEVTFWHQSNRLVESEKIWERARRDDAEFTCANMFWWYNMNSSVDYAVTPRPMYPADGRKIPDVYTTPSPLRHDLQDRFGRFPLFHFWGPRTSIRSTQWIADATMHVDELHDPTLTLVYLPHLDYELQRVGPSASHIPAEVRAVDAVCEELIAHFEARGADVIVLSEYGITPVRRAVSLNRVLRREGFVEVREELGRERLDPAASRAFAVADHQVAHIYVNNPNEQEDVQQLVADVPGVEAVFSGRERTLVGLDHERAGDLVAVADADAWFTYYYWLDDDRAPDYARTVDIHRKPGYDPVELFLDPELPSARLKAGFRLLQKKMGFRYLMDVIALDPSLVKGSHGRLPDEPEDGPLLMTSRPDLLSSTRVHATGVRDIILAHLRRTRPGG